MLVSQRTISCNLASRWYYPILNLTSYASIKLAAHLDGSLITIVEFRIDTNDLLKTLGLGDIFEKPALVHTRIKLEYPLRTHVKTFGYSPNLGHTTDNFQTFRLSGSKKF